MTGKLKSHHYISTKAMKFMVPDKDSNLNITAFSARHYPCILMAKAFVLQSDFTVQMYDFLFLF